MCCIDVLPGGRSMIMRRPILATITMVWQSGVGCGYAAIRLRIRTDATVAEYRNRELYVDADGGARRRVTEAGVALPCCVDTPRARIALGHCAMYESTTPQKCSKVEASLRISRGDSPSWGPIMRHADFV